MTNQYKLAFMRYLDQKGIRYTDSDDTTVSVSFKGDNLDSIRVSIHFADDGSSNAVHFISWSIGSMKADDKYAKAIVLCNQMNLTWRWVTFSIDDERDIKVEADARLDMASAGEECYKLMTSIVNRVDDTYPDFMRLRYT